MTIYWKNLKDETAAIEQGTVTRKTPGLTVEVNGRKYRTDREGWGGHSSWRIFTR
jgi:hypothetical protein